jgi:hypothetical protein
MKNILLNHTKQSESGFIKWIIIIIVGIIIASYFFNFDLQKAVEDEQTQSNFSYIKSELTDFYKEKIEPLVKPLLIDKAKDLILGGESSSLLFPSDIDINKLGVDLLSEDLLSGEIASPENN